MARRSGPPEIRPYPGKAITPYQPPQLAGGGELGTPLPGAMHPFAAHLNLGLGGFYRGLHLAAGRLSQATVPRTVNVPTPRPAKVVEDGARFTVQATALIA